VNTNIENLGPESPDCGRLGPVQVPTAPFDHRLSQDIDRCLYLEVVPTGAAKRLWGRLLRSYIGRLPYGGFCHEH
jgi:hypothetical protein